jgi:CheY-like chemotaxis protein
MMRQIVESFGATVDGACDGAQALQMAWENRPDLIFADLAMPILDGYAFLARVRADPGLSRVPVIAVSAHGSEDDIMRTWREGFSGHLVKPVDYGVIAAQLRRAFWAHDRRSPLPASL